MSEFILGVKPQYDGLLIEPCLPLRYGTYTLHRRFRDAVYEIHVRMTGAGGSRFIPYRPGRQVIDIEI